MKPNPEVSLISIGPQVSLGYSSLVHYEFGLIYMRLLTSSDTIS